MYGSSIELELFLPHLCNKTNISSGSPIKKNLLAFHVNARHCLKCAVVQLSGVTLLHYLKAYGSPIKLRNFSHH